MKGEYILSTGIVTDMMTTLYGISHGLSEGNSLGLLPVLAVNFLVLYFCIFTLNRKRSAWVNIILALLGIFRFLVGIYNLTLIF